MYKVDVKISPSEKNIKRRLKDNETEDEYQVLIIYEAYICKNIMALLQNELIYEGYITVYVKGAYTPVSSTKHV